MYSQLMPLFFEYPRDLTNIVITCKSGKYLEEWWCQITKVLLGMKIKSSWIQKDFSDSTPEANVLYKGALD